ncbi:MAG: beta-ketoacyl-ACP synthase III [Anaerolineae bacterium]
MKYAHITGWGKATPQIVLTNDDMAKVVDTSDEWIREHTGIRQRYMAGPEETAGSLSVDASRIALERAGIGAADLDLIILGTSSPDYQLPGGAFVVQAELGATKAGAFDLKAGCSAFVCALSTAAQFIAAGVYERILVIGAEVVSICLDYSDRRICCLFGDGAGAVVLEARDEPGGVLYSDMGADGSQIESLVVLGAGSKYALCHKHLDEGMGHLKLNGGALLKFALRDAMQGILSVMEGAGVSASDIDLFVPSQSNQRLIERLSSTLGIPLEKTVINIDRYANTSAASVPIALAEALDEGRAKEGDKILLFAYGAGLSWAAAVVQMGTSSEQPIAVAWPFLTRARIRVDRAKVALRTTAAVLGAKVGSIRSKR